MRTLKGIFTTLIIAVAAFAVSAQNNLTSLDGSRVNVEGQNGKVVILAVGASWLPLSVKQADFANALAKKYTGKNVSVYFVFTDSANPKSKNYASEADLRKFVADNKISVLVLRDSDGAATTSRYMIEQFPSFVVISKSGTQVGEPFGGIDPKYDITVPIGKVVDREM